MKTLQPYRRANSGMLDMVRYELEGNDIDNEHVSAEAANGVLTVKLPKKAGKPVARIPVKAVR